MSINARQVNILRPNTSGTHATLDLYMARKRILSMPWSETASIAVAAANFVLVGATELPTSYLGVMNATPPTLLATNASIACAPLAGAVGTASATIKHSDNLGNVLNIVSIRDASTHDDITVNIAGVERTVFALVQCANGVSDGTAVAATASANTQLSFVYIAADGTLTLTAITATIEFGVNKVYIESQQPDVAMEGGRPEELVVEAGAITPIVSKFTTTVAYTNGEVITISTGNGAGAGRATPVVVPTGSTVALPATEALFNNSNLYKMRLNGVQLINDVEVEWESSTTFSINYIIDIGDVFEVEVPSL